MTSNYRIQLRTSRNDYDSATDPNIYQFVAIRGSSGRSGKPALGATPTCSMNEGPISKSLTKLLKRVSENIFIVVAKCDLVSMLRIYMP